MVHIGQKAIVTSLCDTSECSVQSDSTRLLSCAVSGAWLCTGCAVRGGRALPGPRTCPALCRCAAPPPATRLPSERMHSAHKPILLLAHSLRASILAWRRLGGGGGGQEPRGQLVAPAPRAQPSGKAAVTAAGKAEHHGAWARPSS